MLLAIGMAALITACGGDDKKSSGDDDLEDVRPYRTASPYADVLSSCAQADSEGTSCYLSTLPPLGVDAAEPSVDDVMNRLVVSHEWMGARFEQLLHALPEDIWRLMRAVTVIVIDDDIRPSYYWSLTGAIYLDPASLWLTQAEKSVINRAPDYREAFANAMSFRSFWRYTLDNGPAYQYYGLSSTSDRTLDDIIVPMASLLFHELAHANDIMPPDRFGELDLSQRFVVAASNTYSERLSTELMLTMGLESFDMFRVADILYHGAEPTESDTALTAQQVGEFFTADHASDDYAYASQYEDLAMLFEEAMMKLHFDIDRDMAFVTAPEEAEYCNDYKVGWGARNRFAEATVKPRALWATHALLPGRDYSAFFDQLNTAIELPQGLGWCASQDLSVMLYSKPASGLHNRAQFSTQQHVQPHWFTRPYRIHK